MGIGRAYGTVAFSGNKIVLTDVLPHVAIKLKQMFARVEKTQTKNFTLPATDEMCADLSWFMERYPLVMEEHTKRKLKKQAKQFQIDRESLEAIHLPDWKPPALAGFRDGFALTQAQQIPVEIMRKRKSLLLGDDVGLGKTWVAMACAMVFGVTAVVVQTHLPSQWVDEYIVPYTNLRVVIIDTTVPFDLPDADIYIFSYSKLAGWVDVFAEGFFKLVVFDEIQELRTGNTSDKGRAAMQLADNAEARLGLSATPVFNYGAEIWNIMRCIDPDVLGPLDEFYREWCSVNASGKWIVKDPDALGSYLRDSGASLRRLREGRPVNRLEIEVDYDHKLANAASDLTRMLAQKVLRGSFNEAGNAARELDALARRLTGLSKAHGVAAYAKILLSSDIPVIISGWHRDVYEIWMKELKDFSPILYTGSESPRQKDKNKKAFIRGRAKGGTDCMIISNRSGAGLDGLQRRCSTLLVGELDWSPQIYEQLIGRVDRPGQTQPEITAIFLTANAGSDPTIMAVNAFKRDQARGIMDPGMGEAPVYADISHIKLLAQNYLERITE